MHSYTIADAQRLNVLKHQIRAVIRALDEAERVYPETLEAAQVKREVSVLLSELHIHGLLPTDVKLEHDPDAGGEREGADVTVSKDQN